jgi:hypothetical protein
MVRIDVVQDESSTVVLVAGRLQDGAVEELSDACDRLDVPYTLDLAELVSADAAGINLIRTLSSAGAVVRGQSPYLRLLLDDVRL